MTDLVKSSLFRPREPATDDKLRKYGDLSVVHDTMLLLLRGLNPQHDALL